MKAITANGSLRINSKKIHGNHVLRDSASTVFTAIIALSMVTGNLGPITNRHPLTDRQKLA